MQSLKVLVALAVATFTLAGPAGPGIDPNTPHPIPLDGIPCRKTVGTSCLVGAPGLYCCNDGSVCVMDPDGGSMNGYDVGTCTAMAAGGGGAK
ncbi:hypothetical protein SCHPADRAFT_940402 [Schizopora paradoxa]|uniref:Uncharacterized protein n=1 Tax=Schizopora paradoxa TaxID=27342 RepID=A0A0H2S950_9AGAM|nr:hypothetical protein SCHPADRAFT_940402 [Schizopora paradoxa]